MAVHYRLLIALVAGALLGSTLHSHVDVQWLQDVNQHLLQPIGQVFLRMIFMVVVPLVFSALVLGIYELGQGKGLGKVAARTIGFTVLASSASVLVGITLVNLLRPGEGFMLDPSMISEQTKSLSTIQQNASAAKSTSQSIVELITRNPLDSALRALDGEMLSFMFFALFFGLGLVYSAPKDREDGVIIPLLERVMHASMKIVEFAMKIAPLAVFVIVFNTAFKFGYGIFASLFYYVAIVIVGLAIQQFVVYSALLKIFTKIKPSWFFSQCREVYLYAFSTASSNATLPRSLDVAERKLHLPPRIARFVLTVGATANQNGTALFEGITVLFLAQVYGVQLDLSQQIQVVLMSILAGIGTAGVPGGSLPLIMILLQSVGIPPEGLGLILGVDRILDMCRTTLNVSGDLVIAALVSESSDSKAV
jgi:DAACS family dicarboxylate/amino acid:cation (Na+ or H+) symporter